MSPHCAEERRERDADARDELGLATVTEIERPQVRIRELVGQGAELGQDRAPPPLARGELEDVDPQRVAELRSLNVHRPEQVVEGVEIEARLLVAGALVHLSVTGHEQVIVHGVSRADPQRRLERVVPPVMDALRVDLVLHRSPLSLSLARNVAAGGQLPGPAAPIAQRAMT
jgi:hypothetical protein